MTRVKTGFLLLSLTTVIVLSGCSKESVRWNLVGVDYSASTLDVYWEREVILDKTRFWEHSLNLKVIGSSFLRTRMDLNSLRSIDETIPQKTFHTVHQAKTNCLAALDLLKMQDDVTVADVNCEGNWALLHTATSQWLVHFGSKAQTNLIPNIRPFSLQWGAVNESGDCALFGIGSSFQRSLKDGVPFALLRNGKWWEARLPGGFPDRGTRNYSRTSTIPALVLISEAHLEKIELNTPTNAAAMPRK